MAMLFVSLSLSPLLCSHFGYYIVAAAALASLDPSWLDAGNNRVFVQTMLRDVVNPSRADTWFPMFRALDWYSGHSWSRGILYSIDGKDQVNLLPWMLLGACSHDEHGDGCV